MLRPANNVFSVVLDDETVTTLPAEGVVVTSANLGNGAVVLVNEGLVRLSAAAFTALSATDKFMLIQGKGTSSPLMKSPVITKGAYATSIQKHLPAVQQISTIGYNGTAGSLPSANDTSYFIKLQKNDSDAANRSQPASLFAQFKTDATATQEELALGLVENGIVNMIDEPANRYLTFSALCDEAGAALAATGAGAVANLVFTKGSRVVESALVGVTATLTSGGIALAAGDVIKVAAATTSSIYKIKSVVLGTATTKTKITLTYAFQEATATVAIGTARRILAAASILAECGVRVTGNVADFDVNAFRNYYSNRFTASFSDTATLITTIQGARNGSGVWQQVAMDEYMSYGFEGQNGMIGVPPTMRDQTVKIPGVSGATAALSRYSTLNISWTETITGLVSQSGAKGNVVLYTNLDAAGVLATSGSTAETLVVAMGLTAADFDA